MFLEYLTNPSFNEQREPFYHNHGNNTAQRGTIERLACNYTLTLTKFNNYSYPGENTIRTTWF